MISILRYISLCVCVANLITGCAFENTAHISSRWHASVAPAEHNGSDRSSVFSAARPPAPGGRPIITTALIEGAYNIVTREPNELFILAGVIAESNTQGRPAIIKLDPGGMNKIWRAPLHWTNDEWLYPGAVGAHANGFVYVVQGSRIYKVDSRTGEILIERALPVSQARADTAFNGFIVMSDGKIVTKSIHRQPGCDIQGFTALIECGRDRRAPSMIAVIDPDSLDIMWSGLADTVVGGRLSSATWRGVEYLYLASGPFIARMIYRDGQLEKDETWGPVRYLRQGERPGTAPVPFGGYVLIQNNATPVPTPMRLTALSQDDSSRRFEISPFQGLTDISFIPSKPTADWENRRVYVVDGYGGTAALDFDGRDGFSLAWRAADRSLSFSALAGSVTNRGLATTSIQNPKSSKTGWLEYESEHVVWRDADTGEEIARTHDLPPGPGLHIAPGYNGLFFYVSFESVHKISFHTELN